MPHGAPLVSPRLNLETTRLATPQRQDGRFVTPNAYGQGLVRPPTRGLNRHSLRTPSAPPVKPHTPVGPAARPPIGRVASSRRERLLAALADERAKDSLGERLIAKYCVHRDEAVNEMVRREIEIFVHARGNSPSQLDLDKLDKQIKILRAGLTPVVPRPASAPDVETIVARPFSAKAESEVADDDELLDEWAAVTQLEMEEFLNEQARLRQMSTQARQAFISELDLLKAERERQAAAARQAAKDEAELEEQELKRWKIEQAREQEVRRIRAQRERNIRQRQVEEKAEQRHREREEEARQGREYLEAIQLDLRRQHELQSSERQRKQADIRRQMEDAQRTIVERKEREAREARMEQELFEQHLRDMDEQAQARARQLRQLQTQREARASLIRERLTKSLEEQSVEAEKRANREQEMMNQQYCAQEEARRERQRRQRLECMEAMEREIAIKNQRRRAEREELSLEAQSLLSGAQAATQRDKDARAERRRKNLEYAKELQEQIRLNNRRKKIEAHVMSDTERLMNRNILTTAIYSGTPPASLRTGSSAHGTPMIRQGRKTGLY